MYNNLDDQLLIMQALIYSKNQDTDDKMKKRDCDIADTKTLLKYLMVKN